MIGFTKGEWKFIVTDDGDLVVEIPRGHTISIGNMEGACPECFANGRLIAASPLLYESLKDLLAQVEDEAKALDLFCDNWPNVKNARAALAKAKTP